MPIQFLRDLDVLVKTAGFNFDCFGKSLAMDHAFRDLEVAKKYLINTEIQELNFPHTAAAGDAINAICKAQKFLSPYTVSTQTIKCL
jgi:hypothetical protein